MSTTAQAPRRVEVFDGLRGIAIILVVLSHGWAIWPSERVLSNDPLDTLFRAGNFAVSIFFVVGAFVATQALLRRAQSPAGLHPAVETVRRYVRLTGQVGFFLLVAVLVTVFDETDPNADKSTRTSALRVLTYSWNWYVRSSSYEARPDFGHLWYLSVYLQALVLLTVLVFVLRRRPAWLVAALTVLIVASWAWTAHVVGTESEISSLLRTSVRVDAPFAGALAAAVLPYLRRLQPYAGWLLAFSTLALVGLLYATTHEPYLGLYGRLTTVALFLFVVSAATGPVPRPVNATLGFPPLVFLGSRSLGLYIWHYPVFFFVPRHTLDWHWGWRTAFALALTFACVIVSEWLVENRVQRALAAPGWRQLEFGFPAYLRRTWKTWRARRAARTPEDGPPPRQRSSA